MDKLVVILGPTCTGKTSLAEELCVKHNGEIVSADSRQVYRYMDIGTGKLPKSKQVVTHLQDVARPDQEYSVSHWAEGAQRVIENIWQRGKASFVVGGTGFYIDILLGLRGLAGVEPNYKLRRELETLSKEELFERLREVNPERAESIDRNNPRRLIRAIEISKSSRANSASLSTPRERFELSNTLVIGLKASNGYLYARADKWVEKIMENNALLSETACLLEKGYRDTPPLQGIIYKTVLDYFDRKIEYEQMVQRIKFDIHQYIRRQLTWFKKSPPRIHWFDISELNHMQRVKNIVEFYLDG